mgnify:CR=1 FL=1
MANDSGSQRYRSRIEIIYDILHRISESGPILKTHILYGANLNSKSLEKFLDQLMRANLVAKITSRNGRTYYTLTLRGRSLLNHIKHIHILLDEKHSSPSYKLYSALQSIITAKNIHVHVLRNHRVKGASGHVHTYNMYLKTNSTKGGIAIYVVDPEASAEDVVQDLSMFALSLIDTSSRGIFIVPEQHYEYAVRYYRTVFEHSHSIPRAISIPSLSIERYSVLDSYSDMAERIVRIAVSNTVSQTQT